AVVLLRPTRACDEHYRSTLLCARALGGCARALLRMGPCTWIRGAGEPAWMRSRSPRSSRRNPRTSGRAYRKVEAVGARTTPDRLQSSSALRLQLLLELVQCAVAWQHLIHTGIRRAPFTNGREELAILQLDAVHRYLHLGDIDRL